MGNAYVVKSFREDGTMLAEFQMEEDSTWLQKCCCPSCRELSLDLVEKRSETAAIRLNAEGQMEEEQG
eukprot:GSA25T00000047001.1